MFNLALDIGTRKIIKCEYISIDYTTMLVSLSS